MHPVNVEASAATLPTLFYGRIILGEITPILAGMKKITQRWSSHQQDIEKDPLVQQLRELQMTINYLKPDEYLEPSSFLDPFLAIIRSEYTTGPVTKSALAAVNRMLNYGLIDPTNETACVAVESVAAAVTHARFVGTDQGADEVVLWEILTVLRTLILGPIGHLLTNESVCEILNSSFRICFESRLSELLRNCTEDALRHMVQLLFARLPQFTDEPSAQTRRLNMKAANGKGNKGKLEVANPLPIPTPLLAGAESDNGKVLLDPSSEVSVTLGNTGEDNDASTHSDVIETNSPSPMEPLDISHTHLAPESTITPLEEGLSNSDVQKENEAALNKESRMTAMLNSERVRTESLSLHESKEDFINLQGVKFTSEGTTKEGNTLVPYGLPCVREVFRFLISLISPLNDQTSSTMILTALNLLTVALEVGAEHINRIHSLLELVKDHLCRSLFMLMKPESKAPVFLASLRVCTILFESLRTHLKFQLEMFINILITTINSESNSVMYTLKEYSLEAIIQLWRMPDLITEMFLNFDCNLYASNVFEELTKILSKNAFPIQGFYSTNLLSLEALLTVIDTIDSHCTPNRRRKRVQTSTAEELMSPAVVIPVTSGYLLGLGLLGGYSPVTPQLKVRVSMIGCDKSFSRESLLIAKEKKKLLTIGTEQFNVKPEKGIEFLQEKQIIGTGYSDITDFLKGNPHLDKKVIGDYISKKKNVAVLSAFIESFDFKSLRIDQCLRVFLETFRLPGEAPLISIIIEHFASHWHSSNGNEFGKDDAAFTLAYAVIMLNVDQHNQNAKKQNIPMTLEQFKNNLRGINNGNDFDQRMLEDIYCAIRNEEIVMPAEQMGLVKENYLWKMLLRRGSSEEGRYLLSHPSYAFDRDLFTICWGPMIVSLAYVFDKSNDDIFVNKAIVGFKKCAAIAGRYGMSDVFDNLVVSLCKFTTLTSSTDFAEQMAASFGGNIKAQLAAVTVFRLVTLHGDILRDGWKNIVELMLQLFLCHLLPSPLIESEDLVEPSGKVSLVKEIPENVPRAEAGLLSSLYSYIALGDTGRGISCEEAEMISKAKVCIFDCRPEKLVTESAFLPYDSLDELIKTVINAGDLSRIADSAIVPSSKYPTDRKVESGLDEHSEAFLLELVVSILIANKDRAGGIWPLIRDHIYSLLMEAVAADKHFLLERCIVAILRIAKVLLRRPELANPILQSLRMLLLLRPPVFNRTALHVVCGIYEVLCVNADHIRDPRDWAILFALLECAGAGAKPPPVVTSDPHTDEISEQEGEGDILSELELPCCHEGDVDQNSKAPPLDENRQSKPFDVDMNASTKPSWGASPEALNNSGGWIMVGREGEIEHVAVRATCVNEWDIVYQRKFGQHKPEALMKAIDALAFLVRERHITAASLPSVIQACRTFVEATLHGMKFEKRQTSRSPPLLKSNRRIDATEVTSRNSKSPNTCAHECDKPNSESLPIFYQQLSEKLLDLMDTLHSSSSHILSQQKHTDFQFGQSNYSVSLWNQALCPLLQGIARYCCDIRISIRNLAMTYLQRALLNHDLQTLSAEEWESCFNKVLFPLLAKLLLPMGPPSSAVIEETRLRAATLVQKVYLRHLTPLLSLPTFTALWLTILDFMDRYLNIQKSDHLSDAVPEILKNMLLVMETTQVFQTSEGFTQLWSITWDRIDAFLPQFRHDFFRSHPPSQLHQIEVLPMAEDHAKQELIHCDHLPDDDFPPSLLEQGAVRLSLSQEELPTSLSSHFILQPPLPHLLPVSSSLPGSGSNGSSTVWTQDRTFRPHSSSDEEKDEEEDSKFCFAPPSFLNESAAVSCLPAYPSLFYSPSSNAGRDLPPLAKGAPTPPAEDVIPGPDQLNVSYAFTDSSPKDQTIDQTSNSSNPFSQPNQNKEQLGSSE